jgi:CheY-like chemotaxis protein
MSPKPLRIVIVDDEARYRDSLSEKLGDRSMKCVPLAPPKTPVADEIAREHPDAVLVDYQLTTAPRGSAHPPASYLGSLLVAAIREKLPTTPIVLLTRRTLASRGQDFLGRASDLDEVFDDLQFKEDVEAAPAKLRTELRSLVEGYRTLAGAHDSWNDVTAALRTPAYAKDELRRFGAPGGKLRTATFRPGSIARWIRRAVLRFPGLLVDDLRAATDLGITSQSFRKQAVQSWFKSALYDGIFASEERRWWRGALAARADSLHADAPLDEMGDDQASDFRRRWNAKHPSARLQASKCCVCGLPTRDAVCEVRQEPVMLRCSVPYYPDNRPAGFDVARISFLAIRETTVKDEDFASNVLPLLRKIEAGSEH